MLTSITTKAILKPFPYPITLAAIQQAFAATCGWAGLPRADRGAMIRNTHLHLATLPVAAVMVVALISYRWSLMSVSVAFTHTVKTLGPVFTIGFSRLLLGDATSPRCVDADRSRSGPPQPAAPEQPTHAALLDARLSAAAPSPSCPWCSASP